MTPKNRCADLPLVEPISASSATAFKSPYGSAAAVSSGSTSSAGSTPCRHSVRAASIQVNVDVIDFYDLPAANWPEYNKGLTLADATAALAVLVAHPGCAGLTVTEFNPDRGEPDGSTARTLAAALATALSGRPY